MLRFWSLGGGHQSNEGPAKVARKAPSGEKSSLFWGYKAFKNKALGIFFVFLCIGMNSA